MHFLHMQRSFVHMQVNNQHISTYAHSIIWNKLFLLIIIICLSACNNIANIYNDTLSLVLNEAFVCVRRT